jgi:acylglycerol lipase
MKQLLAICISILTLNVMGQDNQQAFSFDEIKRNGEDIDAEPQQFESYDRTKINYYQFIPDSSAIAKLIFIHGGGAHSSLGYFQLAQTLQKSFNIETLLIDIRGHGLSEGNRGDCPNVKSLYKDISSIIQIAKEGNSLPIYLGGHSSGGGLVLNYSSWKKKETVNGYFFISPELGYKSNTERQNRVSFATVKVWKFVINGISQGLLLQHSKAVFFNYPERIIEENPLMLTSISVNMAKALTPKNPKKQFQKITESIALFIGEEDELFEPQKLIEYANMPESKNNKTIAKILPNRKHLSILNDIGYTIGHTIKKWHE